MANDLNLKLENFEHIFPLMKNYIGYIDPMVNEVDHFDDMLYSFVKAGDGRFCAFKPDVLPNGNAAAFNIKDGYWNAFARALQSNVLPLNEIDVISIINHDNAHWTSSVAKMQLSDEPYASVKNALYEKYDENTISKMSLNQIKNFIGEVLGYNIHESLQLSGVHSIRVEHYDSFNSVGDEKSHCFNTYRTSLNALFNENNNIKSSILARPCKAQQGYTCGDHALYNGYVAGVLDKDLGKEENQVGSQALRAYTEAKVNTLKSLDEDKHEVLQVENKIKEMLVSLNKEKAYQEISKSVEKDVLFSKKEEEKIPLFLKKSENKKSFSSDLDFKKNTGKNDVIYSPFLSIENLQFFLAQEENKKKYKIKNFHAIKGYKNPHLEVTMDTKERHKFYAEARASGVSFSVREDFPNKHIIEVCKMVIASAQEDDVFDLSNTAEEKRAVVYESLCLAISEMKAQDGKEAVEEQIKNRIIGYAPGIKTLKP